MASVEPVSLLASGSDVTVLAYCGCPKRVRLRSQDCTEGERSISTDNRLISGQGFVKVATMPPSSLTVPKLIESPNRLVRNIYVTRATSLPRGPTRLYSNSRSLFG